MIYLPKIPHMPFPDGKTENKYCDEKLIDLKEHFGDRLIISPAYYEQQINGSVNLCLLRQGAVRLLEKALCSLPEKITFQVFDSWRPIEVQRALHEKYYEDVRRKFGNTKNEKELCEITKSFVSLPSKDPESPSVHNTGGAIDLTLFDTKKNKPLDMGTDFDEFRETANTDFFETKANNEVKENRRMLYSVMTSAGFTNLPTEWWHYDYGDRFWSFYTGKPAIYGRVEENRDNDK